jgi:NADPH:quinone reductase
VPVASLRRKPKNTKLRRSRVGRRELYGRVVRHRSSRPETRGDRTPIGAGAGVGSAAARIARRLGARVIGADRRAPAHTAPIVAIAETLIIGAQDLPAEVRAATEGKGADVVFDLVGGMMFRSALKCLAWRGRLVEIAATGRREVSFDLADFYHNESRLFGVDTLKRDLTASAEVLDGLKVANGATGRIMLRPQD